jgi:hypothetical protein
MQLKVIITIMMFWFSVLDPSVFSDVLKVPSQYSTIQSAIDNADNNDIVLVADGIYEGEGNICIVLRGKAITVKSENGPENCIIDCNGAMWRDNRGFYVYQGEDANSIIDGFTIQNGWGMMWDTQNNRAGGGGGIRIVNSSPTIKNCIFLSNTGNDGGAIDCVRSNGKITNCTFIDNFAWRGSAIFCDNSIKWHPGPINGGPIISNCLFFKNKAKLKEYYLAGTIFCANSSLVISNCTLTNNNYGIYIMEGEVLIDSCIVQGNKNYEIRMPRWYTPIVTIDYSNLDWERILEGDKSILYFLGGNIDEDPCFVNIENDDYRLRFDSPCKDAGDPDYSPDVSEKDIYGEPRISNNRVDIGCDEYYEIECHLKVVPEILNAKSKGLMVVFIEFPEDIKVKSVQELALYTEKSYLVSLKSKRFYIKYGTKTTIVAFFGKQELVEFLNSKENEIIIRGVINNRHFFFGKHKIYIAHSQTLETDLLSLVETSRK